MSYQQKFDSIEVPAFSLAVEQLLPGATGSQIAALLDHRTSRELANHWKAGRRTPAPWALDILERKVRDRANALQSTLERLRVAKAKPGPGKKAGTRNLLKWKAERAAREANKP
jgi:hypothetical protein